MDSLPGFQTEMVIAVRADLQVGFQLGDKYLLLTFFTFNPEIFILGGFFSAKACFDFIYPRHF
jgi:hypothetical protein